jgi:glycosyltransferase involved in cell wall biosynthesis
MQRHRIRLLTFLTNFGIGGTERHAVNLMKALDPLRFELHLGCLRRWGNLLQEVEALRIPLTEYKTDGFYSWKALREQLRFARYLKWNRIQVVHAYNLYANVFAIPAARLAGVPVVMASIRDMGTYLTPIQRRVQRFVCALADCVVGNAEAVGRWLLSEGYAPEKIRIIRNGIDVSRFSKGEDGAGLRQELGLPPRAPLVAVVSRLDAVKGLEDFVEAAAVVARRVPDVRFLIVGDPRFTVKDGVLVKDLAYQSELETRATRLGLGGRVVFTGFRSDVAKVLSAVAVSVLPSISEALSNTLLESMVAGVPVVATRVGGSPEVVEEGITGLLVPPRDPASLARAICLLLEDRELASKFSRAARQRVAEQFSLPKMLRATEDLYIELLRAKGYV